MTELDAVYDLIPPMECKGHCVGACGPIGLFAVEVDRLRDNAINLPTAADHPVHGPMACSKLTDAGRCSVYENRPFICRLFGAVRAMRCPFGCKPAKGFLSDERAKILIAEMKRLSGDRPEYFSADMT